MKPMKPPSGERLKATSFRNGAGARDKRKLKSEAKRGQMRPLTADQLYRIRGRLEDDGCVRNLTLFSVAVDTMLRASDIVNLRLSDVLDRNHNVVEQFTVVQIKTGHPVSVQLSGPTMACIDKLRQEKRGPDSYLFTASRTTLNRPLTTRAFRNFVKEWVAGIGLDPTYYSGHSLRRSKATILYKQSQNIRAIQLLLGHTTMAHTQEYLGVNLSDALDLAKGCNVYERTR